MPKRERENRGFSFAPVFGRELMSIRARRRHQGERALSRLIESLESADDAQCVETVRTAANFAGTELDALEFRASALSTSIQQLAGAPGQASNSVQSLQSAMADALRQGKEKRADAKSEADRVHVSVDLQDIRKAARGGLENALGAAQQATKAEALMCDCEEAAETATREQQSDATASAQSARLKALRAEALDLDLTGLALSGGGIRSATFALGILQALAMLRLLGRFDYLSTVSGGGYIGSWLAGWISREKSLHNVELQLDPSRVSQSMAERTVRQPRLHPELLPVQQVIDEEPEPVRHLRSYSRYLTPRPGLLSVDTWTLASIYVRNLLINLLFIVPAAIVLVAITHLIVWWFAQIAMPERAAPWGWTFWAAVVLAISAVIAVGSVFAERVRLEAITQPADPDGRKPEHGTGAVARRIIAPLVVAAATSAWLLSDMAPFAGPVPVTRHPATEWLDRMLAPLPQTWGVRVVALFVGLTFVPSLFASMPSLFASAVHALRRLEGWRIADQPAQHRRMSPWARLLSELIRDVSLGVLIWLALHFVLRKLPSAAATTLAGVPLLLLIFVLCGYAEMALVSRLMDDYEREWRSRLGAMLLLFAAGWLIVFASTIYLPIGLAWLGHPGALYSLAPLWALLTGGGAWAGRSLRSRIPRGTSRFWLRLLAAIGPPLFLVGLLAATSLAVLNITFDRPEQILDTQVARLVATGQSLDMTLRIAALAALLFSLIIDVNHFSLHMVYANRLTRCYLGASQRKHEWQYHVEGPFGDETPAQERQHWGWRSGTAGAPTNADRERPGRRANAFTGFDPRDDLPLFGLRAVDDEGRLGYCGPYPILNTALNLVGGAELAIQDRKAESFVMTPDFAGSRRTGYGRTPDDAHATNLTLGRAMTISGAAVDPNMGYHQSAPLTALMTIFNTRLGWWLENPRSGPSWKARSPGVGFALFDELFGQTEATSDNIHLSDGGHFENLGVYELVRRRCRFIVVSDADVDRRGASTNLANLIRLVKTDFGIRIEIDTSSLEPTHPEGFSKWHCAIGRIRYDDVDEAAVAGILVYLRASLTGDEPPDVLQYAASKAAFPHQSTIDQFFDESQFESYRALGFHIGLEVFAEAAGPARQAASGLRSLVDDNRAFFSRVRRRWFPPPPAAEARFVETAQKAIDIEKTIRTDPRLERFSRVLYPEAIRESPEDRAELHTVNDMLQVMEMTWFAMRLDDYYAHPLNRGWMNTFRRWTSADAFQLYWPFLRAEYSQDFVRFCERALNLSPTDVESLQLDPKKKISPTLLLLSHQLDREFELEWRSELTRLQLTGLVDGIVPRVERAQQLAEATKTIPLVWLLFLRRATQRGSLLPCGLVCAAPLQEGMPNVPRSTLELFVWLRGPYRNLGIGRARVRTILDTIVAIANQMPAPHPDRLLARYPEAGVSNAERLDKAMWMSFFFDYGFRSTRITDQDAKPGLVTLSRQLR